MRSLLAILAVGIFIPCVAAQEGRTSEEKILKRVDEVLKEETGKLREELLDLVRREFSRGKAAPPLPKGPVGKALALVTEDSLEKDLSILASDAFNGRHAGYPGCKKAAEYIAKEMELAGLRPAGDKGTFFQEFSAGGRRTRNVIGLLEGSDPALKDEFVVIGAHYDHVGSADRRHFGQMGRRSGEDKIWNGADDNASGTTCVIAAARAFGRGGLRPRRSILFIAFGAEELGLIGSRYYVRHPVGTIEKHKFMLNLDMVGRNPGRAVSVLGTDSDASGQVRRAVESAAESAGLSIRMRGESALLGGGSDHASFRSRRVPIAFFFAGFHSDYHRVTDHADKIAYDKMMRIARASVLILQEIADADETPRFQAKARSLPVPDLDAPSRSRRLLGVQVSELDDAALKELGRGEKEGGVRIEGVHEGSVAEAAGMRQGDVILSVAGQQIPRSGALGRLREILAREVEPKKKITIEISRNGRKVELTATWKK